MTKSVVYLIELAQLLMYCTSTELILAFINLTVMILAYWHYYRHLCTDSATVNN